VTTQYAARTLRFAVGASGLAVALALAAAATAVSGQQGPTVAIENGQVPEGGTEVTRLSAADVADPSLCAFAVDVVFDRTVNVPTGCYADPGQKFDATVCNLDYALETVRVVGATGDPQGVVGNIPLGEITWCALGTAGEASTLDVQVVSFADCGYLPAEITSVAEEDGLNVIMPGSPPADADADGFHDCLEAYLVTDAARSCADTTTANDENPDPWPPDFNDDKVVDLTDALTFLAHYPSAPGSPNWSVRFDLSPDSVVDVIDLTTFLAYFPGSC
jgi:hypothetical protein